jgi:hypothetical protein
MVASMTPSQLEHELNALNSRSFQHPSSGVSQYIRNAERLLAEDKFDSAMDQLIVAQQLDPENAYIRAIMERVLSVKAQKVGKSVARELQITVGKPEAADPTPHDLQFVVKGLTDAAERYQLQGQVETAFDTLMKAYLLDPTSPHVLSREKTVLPAWEMLHKRNAKFESISSRAPAPPVTSPQATPAVMRDSERTIQAKEKERKEKELSLWREVPGAPQVFSLAKPLAIDPATPDAGDTTSNASEGIISRLRKKKLLP